MYELGSRGTRVVLLCVCVCVVGGGVGEGSGEGDESLSGASDTPGVLSAIRFLSTRLSRAVGDVLVFSLRLAATYLCFRARPECEHEG